MSIQDLRTENFLTIIKAYRLPQKIEDLKYNNKSQFEQYVKQKDLFLQNQNNKRQGEGMRWINFTTRLNTLAKLFSLLNDEFFEKEVWGGVFDTRETYTIEQVKSAYCYLIASQFLEVELCPE